MWRGTARRPPRTRTLFPTFVVVFGVLMVALVPLIGAVRAVAEHTPARTAKVSVQPKTVTRSTPKSTVAAARRHTAGKAKTVTVASKPSASLGPLEAIVQTLNNCGPASVAEVLAYWHIYRTQAQVQAVLRADNSYWGTTPIDLPVYAHSLGMRALVAYGGSEGTRRGRTPRRSVGHRHGCRR